MSKTRDAHAIHDVAQDGTEKVQERTNDKKKIAYDYRLVPEDARD